MFNRLRLILEMIRFSHTLFALPFALLASVMAWTTPTAGGELENFRLRELLGILLCMVFARSAAMAFNRIVDRKIDAQNPRTKDRHLPTGSLTLGSVLTFFACCAGGFVAATLLFLPNTLPLVLSIPVLAFLVGYSYAKRFTLLVHLWLGAALMLAPVSAWIAIRGELLWQTPGDLCPAIALGMAVLLWVTGFDIIYACQDADFDKKAHLHSLPARLGVLAALRIAAVCHFCMVLVLIALPLLGAYLHWGPLLDLGWIYACGIAAVAILLVYEHAIVRPEEISRVNIAFFNVNAVLSFGLFLVGTLDLLV